MDTCLTINKANPFPTEREEREFADEFGGLYSLVIKKKSIILWETFRVYQLYFVERIEVLYCITFLLHFVKVNGFITLYTSDASHQ